MRQKPTHSIRKASPKKTELHKPLETSWGGVAHWYDHYLEDSKDSYQAKVILPRLIRMVGSSAHLRILDLACGQGFFTRALRDEGASMVGVDISEELISLARKKEEESGVKPPILYTAAPSHKLDHFGQSSFDCVISVLALQNIEFIQATMNEVAAVLKPGGRFIFVINHPAFRNPQSTHWGYDTEREVQYRRVDAYLSESKTNIVMNPGGKDKKHTVSFHRPLQFWSKALKKAGLAIVRIEEWESHKKSEPGPRQKAEDRARKEIPLFFAVEAVQLSS